MAGWRRTLLGILAPWLPHSPLLEDRLAAAGEERSADVFRLEQMATGLTAAIAVAATYLVAATLGSDVDIRVAPAIMIICFIAGFLARDWWLTRQIGRRQESIRDDLPAAIDLMTLSIMAGESIPAACARVAGSMSGAIGQEFSQVVGDIRGGDPTVDALESFARRVPEVGVGRLVDALVVAVEKGSPLTETLRAQADDGRDARRRYLLEIAGRKEVLMLVPICFLILPTVILFVLYPGLVTLELLVP